jgi:hypothetical protein
MSFRTERSDVRNLRIQMNKKISRYARNDIVVNIYSLDLSFLSIIILNRFSKSSNSTSPHPRVEIFLFPGFTGFPVPDGRSCEPEKHIFKARFVQFHALYFDAAVTSKRH